MRQRFVPAGTLAVLSQCSGRTPAVALDAALVWLGDRAELELGAVAELAGPAWAEALAAYWHQTRRFQNLRRRGGAAGTECVVVRRPLGAWRQETGRTKRDLGPQLVALERLGPTAAQAVHALLDGAPAHDADATEATTELIVLERALGPELGGPATFCEQRRVLRVGARYASWRDRRVRRLVSVEAFADEVWPAPDASVLALVPRARRTKR